uniref:Selenoprotein P N-terminal domain-containing protein n=1 Tax=Oryzias sinensis TaxID=183150 RepID=A0A8C8E1C4_9TELE
MWAGLTLLLALCLLHGGGAESEGGGPRCQPPPAWKIGEVDPMKESMGRVTVVALLKNSSCVRRLDGLHKKLEGQGLKDVVYMVVNHHEAQAQRLHPLLEERLSQNIALYKQHEHQPDVWSTLNGEKDDFFIYDRCGRLTHHLSLPYNIIGHGHVEQAIKEAYCHRVCGECSFEVHTTLSLIPEAHTSLPTSITLETDDGHSCQTNILRLVN